ncbi:50S ribosomal protein P1 [Candidatus Woesearchaeota archaeon]|nr:50S ribosomal protein P1 [Candidatus Woesearchaeota archaeon]
MEYMYAAMLLHKAGSEINEANLTKVLDAAGVKADKAKVTVVVNALKGVDVEKVLKEAVVAPVAAAPAAEASGEAKSEEAPKAEEKKEEVNEEQAAEGLGALFG